MAQSEKKLKKIPAGYLRGLAALAVAALVLVLLVVCLDRPEPPAEPEAQTLPPPEANPYLPEDFVYGRPGRRGWKWGPTSTPRR